MDIDRQKYLVVVPGPMVNRWCYAVEAKLATDSNLSDEVHHAIDHVVLKCAYTDINLTNPENVLSSIFVIDDEYLDLYFKLFRGV